MRRLPLMRLVSPALAEQAVLGEVLLCIQPPMFGKVPLEPSWFTLGTSVAKGSGGTISIVGTPVCHVSSPYHLPSEPLGLCTAIAIPMDRQGRVTSMAHCSACNAY